MKNIKNCLFMIPLIKINLLIQDYPQIPEQGWACVKQAWQGMKTTLRWNLID
jgi:hypothetical protein